MIKYKEPGARRDLHISEGTGMKTCNFKSIPQIDHIKLGKNEPLGRLNEPSKDKLHKPQELWHKLQKNPKMTHTPCTRPIPLLNTNRKQ
jgi:hypothetical protein